MVIPNIPLPVAGSVTPSQPGASSVAGKSEGAATASGESGGLFAALLAALQGVVEGTVAQPVEADGAAGEDASAESVATLVSDADTVDEVDDAIEQPVALPVAPTEVPVVAAAPPVVVAAAPQAVKQQVSETVQTQVPVTETAKASTVADPVPKAEGVAVDVVKPVPANTAQVAPADKPVDTQAVVSPPAPTTADIESVPVAAPQPAESTQPARQAPLLTGVKGPAPTVPSTPIEQPVQVAALAEPRVPANASGTATLQAGDTTAFAKSEPDAPAPIDFEKAKQSLSLARGDDESPRTALRKAIEAFAKPVSGQSESVATTPRPQAPAFAPVTAGENATTQVGDVSRVTAAIAPAELSADAPRSVATPEAPDRPARTSLSDIAQTAVRSIRYLARNGEHRMTLRLIPESLGEVHIEVVSTKDAMSVKLVADSAVVRDAMEAQTHHLRESLSREGLDVRTITVTDDSGSGRGAFQQRDANASRNGERGQFQPGQPPAPDPSSGNHAKYAAPRARHEGAFDQVA